MGDGVRGRAQTVLLTLVGIEVLVLVATGVYLWFSYRPTAVSSWNELYNLRPEVADAVRVRLVHRWASIALIPTGVGAGALVLAEPTRRKGVRDALRFAALALVPITTLYTGHLLAWDQLALNAVTVGTEVSGLRAVLGDDVRFVLIDGVEVDPGTVIAWFVVHVVLSALLVAALVSAVWSRRARRAPASSPETVEAPETTRI